MKRTLAFVLMLAVYCVHGHFSAAVAQSNVLANGGFESGTSSWSWYSSGTATFDAPSPGYAGSYKARVQTGSSMGSNVQLYQYGMSIKADTIYTLSFAAYASAGGSVLVQLLKHTSPYTNYGLYEEVALTSGWQTYQFTFTTSGFSGTTTDVRFRFWFADFASDYETVGLDEVSLVKAVAVNPPSAPALASPSNGATGVSPAPTLTWNSSSGATSYNIEVARSSSFGGTIVDSQTGIASTSYDAASLNNDSTYYWHVRAVNSAGSSSWSSAWHFTVHVDTPSAPVLTDPANNALGVSTSPTFAWNASQGATSYTLQVSLSSGFSSLAVNDSGITETSYGASGLASDTLYYWRVRAVNAGGRSSWSSVRSFHTAGAGLNVLLNGSFEDGTSDWSWWDPSYGSFTTGSPAPGAGSAGGVVTINSTSGGNLQLYQSGFRLTPNTQYSLKFQGYSNTGHDMGVYLQKHTSPYTSYGLPATPDLGTSWQEFEIPFETPSFFDPPDDTASTTDTRLRFWFSDDASDDDAYHLDDLRLSTTSGDTTGPLLQAIATIAGGRTAVADDEVILLDGAASTGPVASWAWSVDGSAISADTTVDYNFALSPNERSKLVTVSLVVSDEEGNVNETQLIIRVTRRPKTTYYLTDHLGTIRSTVKGGNLLLKDDFTLGLVKWHPYVGTGWTYGSGELRTQGMSAQELILANEPPGEFTDGILSVDVKSVSDPNYCGTAVVRFQDAYNFYLIQPQGSQLLIKEKVGGSFSVRASHTLPGGTIQTGRWYRLQVTAEGGKLVAYWDGDSVMSWTDTTPWTSGRVGMWYKGTPEGPNGEARWRNFQATTGYPGQVVTAEDFDPWGLVTRSYVAANADQRFKFTGKERDGESGYDYFGARYYDARIGRWLSVDPQWNPLASTSPYTYALNNPLIIVDPDGRDTLYFDSNGRYLDKQTKKGKGDHVGYYSDKDGNLVKFKFNDQRDAESILSSTSASLVMNVDLNLIDGIAIGENKYGLTLTQENVLSGRFIPVLYPLVESRENQKMDYVVQIDKKDPRIRSVVTVIDGIGYNNFDLGNYYWGMTMGLLGYTPSMAKLAAEVYERVWKGRSDDPTDQRAIEHGARKK